MVALLTAACVPIALFAGIIGVLVIVVAVAIGTWWLSRVAGASPNAALGSDALGGIALLLGGVALCALAVQLVCAAARGEGTRNCSSLCAYAYAPPLPLCANATSHWVDVSEINDAVIGVVYHPERFRALQHPHGIVYLESLTIDGTRYLSDAGALEALVRQAAPAEAGALARSFFAANRHTAPVRQAYRNFAEQVMLDSADADDFLTATTLAEVPLAVSSTMQKLAPNDTVPGVIALSSPGVDTSASKAIVLAVLRSPQSLSRDHVESTRLVLIERSGLSWRAVREWPIAPR